MGINTIFIIILFITLQTFSKASDNMTTVKNKTDFQFLIKSGYRPEKHTLAKYIVSIRTGKPKTYFGDNHFCGGSIYNEYTIITAGHCAVDGKTKKPRNLEDMVIVAGSINRLLQTPTTQIRNPQKLIPHPNYARGNNSYDIALVILDQELVLDGVTVDKISLPEKDYTSTAANCTIFGWGSLFNAGPMPAELVYAHTQLWPKSRCQMFNTIRPNTITNDMICASNPTDYEQDVCDGDSGSPMICDDKQVGIASWNFFCGLYGAPAMYSDVYYFRDWIMDNSSQKFKQTKCIFVILCIISMIS